jgi:WD40 repeat protein
VSGSEDRSVQILDTHSSKQLQKLNDHSDSVISVAFHPNADSTTTSQPSHDLQCVPYRLYSFEYHLHLSRYEPTASLISPLPPSIPTGAYILHLSPTSSSIHFRNDGWVVTSMEDTGVEHRILWLPPSLRPWHPPVVMCISKTGFSKIDLSGCMFGEGWSSIYVG